jgi:hypothetical protein
MDLLVERISKKGAKRQRTEDMKKDLAMKLNRSSLGNGLGKVLEKKSPTVLTRTNNSRDTLGLCRKMSEVPMNDRRVKMRRPSDHMLIVDDARIKRERQKNAISTILDRDDVIHENKLRVTRNWRMIRYS